MIVESIEDEDIILDNSPLNQYLKTINLSNVETDENISKPNQCNRFRFSMLSSLALASVSKYPHLIQNQILENQIVAILHSADSLNILNEADGLHLQYLIASRSIQWNMRTSTTSTHSFDCVPAFLIVPLIAVLIYFSYGLIAISIAVASSLVVYLITLFLYGRLLRYLLSHFFQQMVSISVLSRQTILLIQELLSLNCGYSRLVHLKDPHNYDCAQSFNEDLVESFCRQFSSILCTLSNHLVESNDSLRRRTANSLSLVGELPWCTEENLRERLQPIGEPNYRHPIGQLKHLHNFIQSQFSDCLKMLLLWSYRADNHPSLSVPLHVISDLHYFTEPLQQLTRHRRLLQLQTCSNLQLLHATPKELPDPQMTPIIDSLQTLSLHLFEISQFASQLSENIHHSSPRKPHIDSDWLISKREFVDKSKKHFDAIGNYYQQLCGHFDSLMEARGSGNDGDGSRKSAAPVASDRIDPDDLREPTVIEEYPEIVDEVIEGMPERDDGTRQDYRHRSVVDPFEERYCTNAKAILSELKSVIDVRAKDWRKREKLALKRRAAEGKFVFDKEQRNHMGNVGGDSHERNCQSRSMGLETDDAVSVADNGAMDSDFRRCLGQMVLQQRQQMLIDSDGIGGGEECFGD